MKRMKKARRWWQFLLLLVILFLVAYWEDAWYGLRQAEGQVRVLWEAKPIAHYLGDSQYPDSLKARIRLIQEIRQFAQDSLGLDSSDSYKRMYDQKGKPILWVVTACAPYALEAYQWEFPIAGQFSYKGYFDEAAAQEEAAKLAQAGFDTDIGEVNAWSTLGLLNDPILSNMLDRPVGSLANLIIHELTHGTLYVRSSVEYNENLASFVGDVGAKRFLLSKYGPDSPEYRAYTGEEQDDLLFHRYVIGQAKSLDSLYRSWPTDLANSQRDLLKQDFMQHFVDSLRRMPFQDESYRRAFARERPNNTFFMGILRYRQSQDDFEGEFARFKGDFPAYIRYLKETHGGSWF